MWGQFHWWDPADIGEGAKYIYKKLSKKKRREHGAN